MGGVRKAKPSVGPYGEVYRRDGRWCRRLTARGRRLTAAYVAFYPDTAAVLWRVAPRLAHVVFDVRKLRDEAHEAARDAVVRAALTFDPAYRVGGRRVKFKTYAVRMIVLNARNLLREDGRGCGLSPRDGLLEAIPAPPISPDLDPPPAERLAARMNRVGLNDRERRVLALRYGLEGTTPLRLRQIGTRLRLCKERVRQIEAEALAKLGAELKAAR